MSMRTEDAIYRVEMCGCTGVACIRCNPGPCEHRRETKRHHPWGGQIDVSSDDLSKVPEEDLRGADGDAEPKLDQRDVIRGARTVETWRFL